MAEQAKKTLDNSEIKLNAGVGLSTQHLQLQARWPHLFDCLDPLRFSEEMTGFITTLAASLFDFNSISQGGRGEMYRQAQLDPLVRSVGIRRLFDLISTEEDLNSLTPEHKILDVLGGDGVLARALKLMVPASRMPSIVTSDISEGMVMAAQEYGLFAIQQAAQKLLLKDNKLEGVIIAYGTHHIPMAQRLTACQEAFRVLKPGGRIVLHDFEIDSPMSDWFAEVVDAYSVTGHSFPHFTRQGIGDLLREAGFTNIKVEYLYDPFIISADSEDEAKQKLAEYVLDMYGLAKLTSRYGRAEAVRKVYELSTRYFKYEYSRLGLNDSFGASQIKVQQKNGNWLIESPRVALVGSATKSST